MINELLNEILIHHSDETEIVKYVIFGVSVLSVIGSTMIWLTYLIF